MCWLASAPPAGCFFAFYLCNCFLTSETSYCSIMIISTFSIVLISSEQGKRRTLGGTAAHLILTVVANIERLQVFGETNNCEIISEPVVRVGLCLGVASLTLGIRNAHGEGAAIGSVLNDGLPR